MSVTAAGQGILVDRRCANAQRLARALAEFTPANSTAGRRDAAAGAAGGAAVTPAVDRHRRRGAPTATSGSRCPTPRWACFMATLDGSIVIIALPAIFRGIGLDPLAPGNISYLLWMILGYLLVHGGARGRARPARRHLRPGPHLQPGLRRLHASPRWPLSLDPFTAAPARCG